MVMDPDLATPSKAVDPMEPTWDVARLFPAQGTWTEGEYLALDSNRLVEFSHGCLEVLAMPTTSLQRIAAFLYRLLSAFVATGGLGTVLFAPLRVRLWPGKFREPDLVFMLKEHEARIGEQFWEGADLVLEVVSDDDRRRDVETKRFEYARAGIPEYWIVDPQKSRISVLVLDGGSYREHGVFVPGQRATSVLLSGFEVSVSDTMASGLAVR